MSAATMRGRRTGDRGGAELVVDRGDPTARDLVGVRGRTSADTYDQRSQESHRRKLHRTHENTPPLVSRGLPSHMRPGGVPTLLSGETREQTLRIGADAVEPRRRPDGFRVRVRQLLRRRRLRCADPTGPYAFASISSSASTPLPGGSELVGHRAATPPLRPRLTARSVEYRGVNRVGTSGFDDAVAGIVRPDRPPGWRAAPFRSSRLPPPAARTAAKPRPVPIPPAASTGSDVVSRISCSSGKVPIRPV